MIPLKTNRYFLTWLSLYPNSEGTSATTITVKQIFTVQCFLLTHIGLVGSIGFVCTHILEDLERSLFGILQIAGLFYVNYTQVFARFLRPKIISALDQISKFHESCEFKFMNLFMIHFNRWLFFIDIFLLYFTNR